MSKKLGLAIVSFCLCIGMLLALHPAEAAVRLGASVAIVSVGFYGQNDVETRKILAGKATEFVGEYMFKGSKLKVKDMEEALPELKANGVDTEGNITQDDAAKIGKLLNADYVIYGNIMSLSITHDSTGVVVVETESVIANTDMMLKMVDTHTGSIVSTGRGKGSSRQTSGSVIVPTNTTVGMYQWGSDQLSQEIVDRAVIESSEHAVQELLKKINMQK